MTKAVRIFSPGWVSPVRAEMLVAVYGIRYSLALDSTDLPYDLYSKYLVWRKSVVSAVLKEVRALPESDDRDWCKQTPEKVIRQFMDHSSKWEFFRHVENWADEGNRVTQIQDMLRDTLEALEAALAKSEPSPLEVNIRTLATLLECTPLEQDFLVLSAIYSLTKQLQNSLEDFELNDGVIASLTALLGTYQNIDVEAALYNGGTLTRLGYNVSITESMSSPPGGALAYHLNWRSANLVSLNKAPLSREGLIDVFVKVSKPAKLDLTEFAWVKHLDRVRTFVSNAAKTNMAGAAILIYGPPGVGKTELVRSLAAALDMPLLEVPNKHGDADSMSASDRVRNFMFGQLLLKNSAGLFLFDEVEDVFPVDFNMTDWKKSKSFINDLIENTPKPSFWLTNHIGQIDPAYLRRFAYTLEIPVPPKEVRERVIRQIAGNRVELSDSYISELADRKIPPAHLEGAIKFSKWSKDSDYEEGVTAHIEAMESAIGLSSKQSVRAMPTQYSLDLLNMDTKYPIPKIIERIKQAPATMCFYGAPGTGKTALAEHITKMTGKPLLIKKASDIVSKWVGETEQNIAAMFEEATLENAVLLLDEADTFLRSRAMAQHSWEASQVNEMLQQMERYKGVFICTTNLMDNLDEAVLRRFTFKINFKPLTFAQRLTMFQKENGLTVLPVEFERRLEKLAHLTVGDFATVKRQAGVIGEHPTPEEFLVHLEEEHKLKPNVKLDKRVGFGT